MATIPSIPGQVNATSRSADANGDNALFLKVFAGEILTAFNENNIMKDLTMVRSISSGKSASFPVTGTASASYHTPGDSLITGNYLSQIAHNERQVFIDDLLVASTLIANIDELRNHYDLRSIYSAELGKALAKECDLNIIKTFIAAASESATAPQGAGTILNGGDLTTAGAIVSALFSVLRPLTLKMFLLRDVLLLCLLLNTTSFLLLTTQQLTRILLEVAQMLLKELLLKLLVFVSLRVTTSKM